jgi:WhiB family redox-sensing transcriptional regulator
VGFLEGITYLNGDFPDFKEFGAPPCSETDPELFFPPDEFNTLGLLHTNNSGMSIIKNREAIKICNSCPYIEDCLSYALARPEISGIWGGTSQEQRKKMRSEARGEVGVVGRPRNKSS